MPSQDFADLRQVILERHKAAEKGDYYAVLGVERGTDAKDIQTAYIEMAKQVHPDMLEKHNLQDLKQQATAVFRFATEAQGVLSDAKKRSQYDSGDLVPKGVSTSADGGQSAEKKAHEKARIAYHKGSVLLNKRGYAEAEKFLRQATDGNPENGRYWQKLGWAIFQNTGERPEEKRLDEACRCWLSALELNEEDALSHYYVALYHKARNEPKKAKKALERSLRIKPNYVEAKRELRLLKMRMERQRKSAPTGAFGRFLAGLAAGRKKK